MNHRSTITGADVDADAPNEVADAALEAERAKHLAEFLTTKPKPGDMRTLGDREYWCDHQGNIVVMRSIASIPREELDQFVQKMRDDLFLVQEDEKSAPLHDDLAIAGADAVDNLTSLMEEYELNPKLEVAAEAIPAEAVAPEQPAPARAPGSACFGDQWVSPLEHGKGDLAGRRLWIDLAKLQDAMTTEGLSWLGQRQTDAPRARDGLLPSARRLWNSEGPIGLLHETDEFIGIACSDDGDLSEVWAAPSTEAYAASRGIDLTDPQALANAEERLSNAWEEIMDRAMNNTGSTMVIGFEINGDRAKHLDLG